MGLLLLPLSLKGKMSFGLSIFPFPNLPHTVLISSALLVAFLGAANWYLDKSVEEYACSCRSGDTLGLQWDLNSPVLCEWAKSLWKVDLLLFHVNIQGNNTGLHPVQENHLRVTPVAGRTELQESEGSWEGQVLLSLYFSMLQIHWQKDIAWSSWETGFGLEKAVHALFSFALKKEEIIHEEYVDPSFFARTARFGTCFAPKVSSWHWNVFTPLYRG